MGFEIKRNIINNKYMTTKTYEEREQELEQQGCTRSDDQGIVDAEDYKLLIAQNKCTFCELPLSGGNINERCHCD